MNRYTVKELDNILKNSSYEEFIKIKDDIREDDRKGIVNIIQKFERKFQKLKKELSEYQIRKRYENSLKEMGFNFIAGIDEVGRGPLAGPVYAAAVILDSSIDILGIKDSKKLSEAQRENLSQEIKDKSIAYSIGTASVEEIDRYNIFNATKLAMKRAIDLLSNKPDYLLIDAVSIENIDIPQIPIIKGDDLSISIGAASIIAKVERDNYMKRISCEFPEYLLHKNKGYGTQEHIDAIKKFGIASIHRRSFVKNFI